MRFDENAPGGGVEAVCRLENGKAFLEWRLYFAKDLAEPDRSGAQIGIYVTDREGNLVLECRQQLREEEPLQSILLQPRLWRGVEEPYLYDTEAILMDGSGRCRDRVRGRLPLRSLNNLQSGSLALNGAAWEPRAVRYFLPDKGSAADRCRQMEKDLRMLLELGANCVCLEGLDEGRESRDEGRDSRDEGRESRDESRESCDEGRESCDEGRESCDEGRDSRNEGRESWDESLESWDEGRDSRNEGLDDLDESQNGKKGMSRFFLGLCDRLGFLAFGKRKNSPGYVWIQEADIGARMMRREAVILACGGEVPVLRSRKEDVAIRRKDCNSVIKQKDDAVSRGREGGSLQGERGNVSTRCGAEETRLPGDGEGAAGPVEGTVDPRQQAEVLLPDGEHPGACFYRCLAQWGRKPFVHIVPESVRKMKSGNYTVLCYSNCDKVALYSDGILFGFRSGEREFWFQEIPAKSPCIMLAAEGEGCGESLSVHKSFVKQWENEGIWH